MRVVGSQFEPGPKYKSIELPVSYYGFPEFDRVLNSSGELVGLSVHCGYSINESAMLSLAVIDRQYATPGTQVALQWGEPDGGSRKAHVERHEQTEIRATVAPAPYSAKVRELKRAAIGH